MMYPDNVMNYVRSIPELAPKMNAITTASTSKKLTPDQKDAILALVMPDEYTWASAAWYLTATCAIQRPALQTGSEEGFVAYMNCVSHPGVNPPPLTAEDIPERIAKWKQAKTVFGLS